MTVQNSRPKSSVIVSMAILFLILIALPAGSWYYLKTGYDYRKKALAELKDYGKIPSLTLSTFSGRPFSNQDISGRIVVSCFLNLQDQPLRKAFGTSLEKLHQQFDERNEVAFLMHIMDSGADSASVNNFAAQYQLQDTTQCYFLKGNQEVLKQIAENVYKIPDGASMPYFAIADTSGTVRRQYDVRDPKQVKRLVEHIAILLPLEPKRSNSVNQEQGKK